MKFIVLLLLVAFSAAVAAEDTSSLRLFYCIHAEQSCVDPSVAVSANSERVLTVAGRALSAKDDFVGFIDADETTLQFYVEGTDFILVDMPIPELKGSYSTHLSRAKALQIIGRLSAPFSRYRSELNLEFARWN
jgi:hypothetical protein